MKEKICILTTVHKYNDNRVYYKEVQSLSRMGYDVTYVAPNIHGEMLDGVNHCEISVGKSHLKQAFSFIHAFNVVRKLDCKIVHFQDPILILTGFLLKLFTSKKVIYDVHEDYPAQMLTKFYLPVWVRKPLCVVMKMLEWLSGKCFDAIIVADHNVFTHFPPEKTTILYNYPSIELMQKASDVVGEQEKKYDIIFPGSLAKFTAKIILDIMKTAKEKGRELRCILISPFHFDGGKEWVIATAKDYGISDSLTLLDRIPPYDVPKYLKQTKIGLIPLPDTLKMRANIPTKMFEYMFMKLPVLTGDLPPCGYYLKQNKFGYLLQVDSAEDYANKILYLLDNPDEMNRMGELGHELVIKQYNWENEEKKLKEVYSNLLSK